MLCGTIYAATGMHAHYQGAEAKLKQSAEK